MLLTSKPHTTLESLKDETHSMLTSQTSCENQT